MKTPELLDTTQAVLPAALEAFLARQNPLAGACRRPCAMP